MDIFSLLDSLRAIARNGLYYTHDPYDRQRYESLMDLTVQTYAELLEAPGETIRAQFLREMGQVTPKVGADAAIFNANGEILLMERADGRGWCLPCGFVEPNEKPSETFQSLSVSSLEADTSSGLPGIKHRLHTWSLWPTSELSKALSDTW